MYLISWSLLMMIWFIFDNCHCTVNLLYKNHARHLMWKGQFRHRYLYIWPLINGSRKTIGTTNYKDKLTDSGNHFLFNPLWKINRWKLCSMFIEQYQIVTGGDLVKNQLSFFLFLKFCLKRTSIFNIRNDLHFERQIIRETLYVVVNSLSHVLLVGIPNC